MGQSKAAGGIRLCLNALPSPALFFAELYLKQFGWILAILGLLGCIFGRSCGVGTATAKHEGVGAIAI